MDAELALYHRNIAPALIALEGDGAEVPFGFAAFFTVIHLGFHDGGSPERFFNFSFRNQLFGEEHSGSAR